MTRYICPDCDVLIATSDEEGPDCYDYPCNYCLDIDARD